MYEVNLPTFAGPLDLLLHLIKKDDVDIFNIDIDKITKQYLEYIQLMENLNLDIASEYLIMAAELMEIKANSLLPKKEEETKRLIEYEQYKDVTNKFKELENYRHEVYTRQTDELINYKEETTNNNYGINIDDLVKAFKDFIKRKELDKPLKTKIAKKDYSVNIRSQEIKNILKAKKKVSFFELFETYSKDYLVITFLSILSLTKNGEIKIKQDHNFNNITLEENI